MPLHSAALQTLGVTLISPAETTTRRVTLELTTLFCFSATCMCRIMHEIGFLFRNLLDVKRIRKINVCRRIVFSLTFQKCDVNCPYFVNFFPPQNCHRNPKRTDHRLKWKGEEPEFEKLAFEACLLSSNNTVNLLNKGKNSMLISRSPLLEWEMECGNKVTASCIRTWNCPQNWQMLLISGQTHCCQKSPFEADFVDVHRH